MDLTTATTAQLAAVVREAETDAATDVAAAVDTLGPMPAELRDNIIAQVTANYAERAELATRCAAELRRRALAGTPTHKLPYVH